MLKTKYFIGCMLIASMLLSCTKSTSYDIKGDPLVRFFTNNPGPGNAPPNSINFSVVNTPNVAGSGLLNLSSTIPGTIKIPVFATKPLSEDVIIGAVLDNSLIEAYNAAHGTNYAPFPPGIFNTDGLLAHMLQRAIISVDSITITTNLTSVNLLTGTDYMAPIRLSSVSNPDVGELSNNGIAEVVYIVANVEQRRIKYLAVATDALGTLLTSRSSWVVNFNPAPSTVGSIIDGSTTTYSRWSASPGLVDIILPATTNVTGIRVYTSNSSTYVPAKFDVYLSNDGINYDLIGSPLKANLTYASSYNYILFYKAIPAKYIRLRLNYSTSTSSSNLRLAELDVYAN
jgi:hypothetical protein